MSLLEKGWKEFLFRRMERLPLLIIGLKNSFFQRLGKGGYLDDWEARIKELGQADGLEDLIKMKRWTDQMAMASGGFSLSIVYQFDKNRLHPIRLCK